MACIANCIGGAVAGKAHKTVDSTKLNPFTSRAEKAASVAASNDEAALIIAREVAKQEAREGG